MLMFNDEAMEFLDVGEFNNENDTKYFLVEDWPNN